MRFPPTVNLVRWVSFFWGQISTTKRAYVAFLSAGMLDLLKKKIVFVPDFTLVPIPWARHPNSLAQE
eukprot:13728883-Ditylum_brightwellii.AAC.1